MLGLIQKRPVVISFSLKVYFGGKQSDVYAFAMKKQKPINMSY